MQPVQTRAATLDDLPSALASHLRERARAEDLRLGDGWSSRLENPIGASWLHRAIARRLNPDDPNPWTVTFLALTPTLVFATYGPNTRPKAFFAAPESVRITLGQPGSGQRGGLTLNGLHTRHSTPVAHFLPLDGSAQATELVERLAEATGQVDLPERWAASRT